MRRYQHRVFGVALHYLRNREDAQDAAQEIFVKVYRGLGKLEPGRAFLPWLLRVARNGCIDRIRRRKVRTPEIEVPVEDCYDLSADDPTPEDRSLLSGRQALLYQALGQISDNHRELILLKEIQEMEIREIADLLDLPLGTVKSRSNRARLELARAVRSLETGQARNPAVQEVAP